MAVTGLQQEKNENDLIKLIFRILKKKLDVMHRIEWVSEQAKLLSILAYKKSSDNKYNVQSLINGCFLYLLIRYSRVPDTFLGHPTAYFGNAPVIGYPLESLPQESSLINSSKSPVFTVLG